MLCAVQKSAPNFAILKLLHVPW